MPLNEASGRPRSNLTKAQRREQDAAFFGLPVLDMSNLTELTHGEIERMRAIVMAHDKNSGKIQEFDLNNPPTPPYRYQPFPKTVYRGEKNRIVRDQGELDLALEAGWSTSPAMAMAAAAATELDVEAAAEVAEVDARIAAAKKNRK